MFERYASFIPDFEAFQAALKRPRDLFPCLQIEDGDVLALPGQERVASHHRGYADRLLILDLPDHLAVMGDREHRAPAARSRHQRDHGRLAVVAREADAHRLHAGSTLGRHERHDQTGVDPAGEEGAQWHLAHEPRRDRVAQLRLDGLHGVLGRHRPLLTHRRQIPVPPPPDARHVDRAAGDDRGPDGKDHEASLELQPEGVFRIVGARSSSRPTPADARTTGWAEDRRNGRRSRAPTWAPSTRASWR